MTIHEVIIPILGNGSRLWPASGVIPKELLPIGITPLLISSIQEAIEAGITDIHVLTSSTLIVQFLSNSNPALNAKVTKSSTETLSSLKKRAKLICHRMSKTNGLAETIYQSRKLIQGTGFAIMFPDDIIFGEKTFLSKLLRMHEVKKTNIIGLTRIRSHEIEEFGVVTHQRIATREYRILSAVEKRMTTRIQAPLLGIIGRYVLMRDIFPILKSQLSGKSADKFCLTPTLNRLAENGSLFGFLNQQKYFHVGTERGYIKAFLYYGKIRKL